MSVRSTVSEVATQRRGTRLEAAGEYFRMHPAALFRNDKLRRYFTNNESELAQVRRILLCRFGVRRHRSEIMFSVLVIILRPDHVAGLGLSLG
jgi:hypothetical protein